MADGVDVFDRAVRKKQSHFHFVIRLFANCSIGCLLPFDSLLRMNALQPFFPNRHALFRIEAYMRYHSSERCKATSPASREAQLPVWVSLCASAKYASLRWSFSSCSSKV